MNAYRLLSKKMQSHQGFTLIEMAIVLLIAGLLVAGIGQIVGSAQKQRFDQASANEMRSIVTGTERMLVDQQAALTTLMPFDESYKLADTTPNAIPGCGNGAILNCLVTSYLPNGFDLTGYTIGILRHDVASRPSFRALIIRTPDNALDDGRLARVASLIGNQGGLVSNSGNNGNVSGVMGSWSVVSTQYAIPLTSAPKGSIAALTNTVDAQINTNTLSRINPMGTVQSEANTMYTDLYMGSGQPTGMGGGKANANAIVNISALGFALIDIDSLGAGNICSTTTNPAPTINVYQADGTTQIGSITLDAKVLKNKVFFGFSKSQGIGTAEMYKCVCTSGC